MRKVLVATPSYDGKIDVWFANSLTETLKLCLINDILIQPIYMSYDALIQRSRNDLLALAIEGDYDDMFWIDSDIAWQPEWFLNLLNYNVDVVGGTYPKKSLQVEGYPVKCGDTNNLILNPDGLLEVEGLGTGFLRMSKKAIQSLWDNSPEYIENEKSKRWAFDVRIEDKTLISEDIIICKRLKELGFSIYLDPSMTCEHVGNLKYTGNFLEFLKKNDLELKTS